MNYLRSFFLNFLTVFFIDRMAPGMKIAYYEQVPNIGADILFSLIVGLLNASVFFFLYILDLNPTKLKIGVLTFIISYASFIFIAIFSLGVRAESAVGVIVGGGIVWIVALITNVMEFNRDKNLK